MSGIGWRDVNPGLVRIISALALPSSSDPQGPKWLAEWKDRPLAATPDKGPMKGVTLTLKITTVAGIGTDETRYEQDTPTSDLRETIYGLRRVTLRLEASASEVNDSQWALSTLERIRSRLRRRRVIRDLLSLNVGIIDILAATDISSAKQLQRVQSRAVMDLLLTMVSSDEDPVTVGWIAGVQITSLLEDVDGQVLPTPPNYTDTITTP